MRRIGFHALNLVALLVCLTAARWQWASAHRTEADAVPDTIPIAMENLTPANTFAGMRIRLTGQFDATKEVLVKPRTRDTGAGAEVGSWVLTPFLPQVNAQDEDSAIAVVRGWVPQGVAPVAPPIGTVGVVGVLVSDTRVAGALPSGSPAQMPDVDSGALATYAQYPVRSGWIALQSLNPKSVAQPKPLLVSELPGAHVGVNLRNAAYSLQWLIFAGFVVFFWIRFNPGRGANGPTRHDRESPK